MIPQQIDLLGLLQIADSALPTGGYAYSNGLETAAARGLVGTGPELKWYLNCYLRQVGAGEMPFLASCYDLRPPYTGNETLVSMVRLIDAMITVEEIHRASVIQGTNYFRIFARLFPGAEFDDLKTWFHQSGLNTHCVIAYGLCLKQIGYPIAIAQSVYFYIALRDQISAAVRLGIIGPMEAAVFQKDLLTIADDVIAMAPNRYENTYKRSPLIEILQGMHEDLYSRLFQT